MKKLFMLCFSFSAVIAADLVIEEKMTPEKFLAIYVDPQEKIRIELISQRFNAKLFKNAQLGSYSCMDALAKKLLKDIDMPQIAGLYWHAKIATDVTCPEDFKRFAQDEFDRSYSEIFGLAELILTYDVKPTKRKEIRQFLLAWQKKHMPNLFKKENS